MIYGIGCDLIQISRVQRAFSDDKRLSRCFTEKEVAFFDKSSQRIAGNFAAKEAIAKALGTGFRGFSLKDVEILRDELGRPFMTSDSLEKILKALRVDERLKVHLSISHEKEFAMATCILERVKL